MTGAPLLRIRGLRKELRTGNSVFRLVVPEFSLDRGGIYGLTGRSGSGKSTMLDLLALVSRPTAVDQFDFSFDGKEHVDVAQRFDDEGLISRLRSTHFGYVLQSGGLFPYLTVRENILLPLMLAGRRWHEEQVLEAVERLDLIDQLGKKPAALSGGQRQRVSILRAMMKRPALLLADEPTAAIDEALASRVMAELRAMALEQGTTVLIVSHDTEFLRQFASVTVRLAPNRINDHEVETHCELPEAQAARAGAFVATSSALPDQQPAKGHHFAVLRGAPRA